MANHSDERGSMANVQSTKESQGRHELEFFFGESGELQREFPTCEKNPDHSRFIPVGDLSLGVLPKDYRYPVVLECIQSQCALTGRIMVSHTSQSRPSHFPCSELSGSICTRVGTGWVAYVQADRKFPAERGKPCPCLLCSQSDTPCTEWAELTVYTANHVVYDSSEAQHAVVDLFYDQEEDMRTGRVKRLYGHQVWYSDKLEDRCRMDCITHDLGLWEELSQLSTRRDKLQDEVWKKFRSHDGRLTVIVSHPHGCTKHVSFGEWTQRLVIGDNSSCTRYTYNTCTCPGSSGAPVWPLGKERMGFFTTHPHSAEDDQGLNRSGISWE